MDKATDFFGSTHLCGADGEHRVVIACRNAQQETSLGHSLTQGFHSFGSLVAQGAFAEEGLLGIARLKLACAYERIYEGVGVGN